MNKKLINHSKKERNPQNALLKYSVVTLSNQKGCPFNGHPFKTIIFNNNYSKVSAKKHPFSMQIIEKTAKSFPIYMYSICTLIHHIRNTLI